MRRGNRPFGRGPSATVARALMGWEQPIESLDLVQLGLARCKPHERRKSAPAKSWEDAHGPQNGQSVIVAAMNERHSLRKQS